MLEGKGHGNECMAGSVGCQWNKEVVVEVSLIEAGPRGRGLGSSEQWGVVTERSMNLAAFGTL